MSFQETSRKSAPLSRPPSSKSNLLSRVPSYNLIYIPNATGASRRISIPKPAVMVLLLCLFGLVGAVASLSLNITRLHAIATEYEKLKAENHSIRSEAAALVTKLQEVQSNLNRVDQFSDQVREEASQLDAKPARTRNGSLTLVEPAKKKSRALGKNNTTSVKTLPAGVGPLTKEEYAYIQKPGTIAPPEDNANMKMDSLEFKSLFSTLSNIKEKSTEQLQSLGSLLHELQTYRSKLAATPTIAPVEGNVSSLYGWRVSPVTGQNRKHQGLDIAAPLGSPIRTAANGTVIKVGVADDYGNYVEISHGYGVVSRYAHASKINVKVGMKVAKGDVVGNVGMTGRTTGPHLHYEVEVNGQKVNPASFIR